MDKSEQLSQLPRLLQNDLGTVALERISRDMESSEYKPLWDLVPANVCGVFPYSNEWRQESNIWWTIALFIHRTLSFDSDTLDAIPGILQLYQTSSHHKRRIRFLCVLTTVNPVPAEKIELWVDNNDNDDGSVTDFTEMRFVVDQNSNMDLATAQFVSGLAWEDKWSQSTSHFESQTISSKLTDYEKESPRRTMFLTWTWAGWKKTKKYDFACECLGFKYFGHLFYDQSDCLIQPPIKVCIDGKDMNWTTDHLQITELLDSGKIPT